MKSIYSVSVTAAALALLTLTTPVHAGKSDNRVESAAEQSYVFKTYLKGDDIKVKSKEGAVTLSGVVLDESHIALAQETVAGLPGVKSVDNKLKVKPEASTRTNDTWLTTKVKSTLLFHRSVSGSTEVDTKDSVVTLRGTADSQAQKDLTSENVKDLEGVKGVNNEMTVSSNSPSAAKRVVKKIDDASITAQVKMTLLYHRSTSALHTKIKTEKGVVSLNGKAKDAAERDLATKFALDVNGVKSVNNRMTIN